MRVKSLCARNYRTLDDLTVDFVTDYTTLSGHNNAGKSAIIRLLSILFRLPRAPGLDPTLDYLEDCTQWVKNDPSIHIDYTLCLSKTDDYPLLSFIEKFSEQQLREDPIELNVSVAVDLANKPKWTMSIRDKPIGDRGASEILTKLRSSNAMFLHNTPRDTMDYFFRSGKLASAFPVFLSAEEHKKVADAEGKVQRNIKKVTRRHKEECELMLGRLREKYEVSFTSIESLSSRQMPFAINLRDRSAEVPLSDWGSGTQNRTQILMTILQANRIKVGADDENRITPIVVIEEPESFLHPSAQAEFGKLLQEISRELDIQIIASTHSPYMLNQADPSSNILLRRKLVYNKSMGTEKVDTSAEHWMAPFAEHLGIVPPELEKWRFLFGRKGSKVLLVEELRTRNMSSISARSLPMRLIYLTISRYLTIMVKVPSKMLQFFGSLLACWISI